MNISSSTPLWQLTVGEFTELMESLQKPIEPPKTEEEYLTPKEAEKFLKVSKTTLYRWIKNGNIKSQKIGGSQRLLKSELIKIKKVAV